MGGRVRSSLGHDVVVDGGTDDDAIDGEDGFDGDDTDARQEDLLDLIGEGRVGAAAKLAARQLGVVGPARGARQGVRRALVRAARVVDHRRRPLQLVAAAIAAVAAAATLYSIFFLEIHVAGDAEGTTKWVTVWSEARRVAPVGSYELLLRVLAPIVLAVALATARWWRPVLVAVTVYSVHWIGHVASLRSLLAEIEREVAVITWELIALPALAAALVLGCLLVVVGRPAVGGRSPGRAEVATAVAAWVLLALTWGRPQMVFRLEGEQAEVHGLLHGWPLRDLGSIADHPAEYTFRYLPVLLLVVAVLAMFTRPGRGRPGVRCGVWLGLAAGAVADAGQRLPLWHDPAPGYFWNVTETGTWSPDLAAFALLVGSAVAAVTAGWLAWQEIEAPPDGEVSERSDERVEDATSVG
jgi:hypothetical protein